jgi:hypothetical protein
MKSHLEPLSRAVELFDRSQLTEILGQGLRRKGYVHPTQHDIVVKQALNNFGREANLKEWWLWHALDFSVRPLFNPCWRHWNRGEFLAQPRLEPLDDETGSYVEEILSSIPDSDSQLRHKLRRLHLWGWDPILRTPRVFDYEHLAIEDFVEWVPTRIKF